MQPNKEAVKLQILVPKLYFQLLVARLVFHFSH